MIIGLGPAMFILQPVMMLFGLVMILVLVFSIM
jgi:hypothetical protein